METTGLFRNLPTFVVAVAAFSSGVCSTIAQAQSRESLFDDQTIFVRLHEDSTEIDEFVVTQLARGEIIWRSRYVPGLQLVRLEGRDPTAAIERLSLSSDTFLYAERNPIAEPTALCQNPPSTNDTLFPSQWGLENTGQTYTGPNGQPYVGVAGADVRAVCAWTITQGQGQVVAVIDSGIGASITGPEYSGHLWSNQAELNGTPYVDDDGNGFKDDYYGWNFKWNTNDVFDLAGSHGTRCAGVITAERNNAAGISGVAPKSKIMVLRIEGVTPIDPSPTAADLVAAIEYAAQMEIKTVSVSRIFQPYSQALKDTCKAMGEKGMVIVCGAGNHGQNLNNFQGSGWVPASFGGVLENVITVAGTTPKDGICTIPEAGYDSGYGAQVVLVGAPGSYIWTTDNDNNQQPQYVLIGGTSYATPHVAGIVAMIRATHPTWGPSQIRKRIKDTARNVPALSNYTISSGVIDAYACVQP